MRTYLIPGDVLAWFQTLVGAQERTFLSTNTRPVGAPTNRVWIMGSIRLGLAQSRDIDLFTPGTETDGEPPVIAAPSGVSLRWLTTTSAVSGVTRSMQKAEMLSAEGRKVTLTANPYPWFIDMNAEYEEGWLRLRDPAFRAQHDALREQGRKVDAYHLLGVRMNEERA